MRVRSEQPGDPIAGDTAVESDVLLRGRDHRRPVRAGADVAAMPRDDACGTERRISKRDQLPLDRFGGQCHVEGIAEQPRPGAGRQHGRIGMDVAILQSHAD